MAEARIDVIADYREMGNAVGILVEVFVDGIGIAIVAGDETEGRVGILVQPGMEPGADPGDDAGQVNPDAGKQLGVRANAGGVPLFQADVLRVDVAVNLALDQHQVVRLHGDPRAAQRFHQARHVTAGVDDPFGSAGLQAANKRLHRLGNRRALELGEKRAVEVS